jgi:hypothetical protein
MTAGTLSSCVRGGILKPGPRSEQQFRDQSDYSFPRFRVGTSAWTLRVALGHVAKEQMQGRGASRIDVPTRERGNKSSQALFSSPRSRADRPQALFFWVDDYAPISVFALGLDHSCNLPSGAIARVMRSPARLAPGICACSTATQGSARARGVPNKTPLGHISLCRFEFRMSAE